MNDTGIMETNTRAAPSLRDGDTRERDLPGQGGPTEEQLIRYHAWNLSGTRCAADVDVIESAVATLSVRVRGELAVMIRICREQVQ
jgi:hypothetical protein